LRAGLVLHRLEGIVRAEIVRLDHDAASGRFHEDVVWHDSYVAEQHVHHYGKGRGPVCWSLVGYASGHASACLGHDIFFRETECLAQGATSARRSARTPRAGAPSWTRCAPIFKALI
jgi:two-component system, NtrC family, response regulator HydG